MTINHQNVEAPIPSQLVQEDRDFADLVEEFLGGIPERVRQIEAALEEHDFDSLRSFAHQLKGSGGGYGYPTVTETAATLEQRALAAELDACQAGVGELKELLSRLVVSID